MDDDTLLRERMRHKSTLLPGPGSKAAVRPPEAAENGGAEPGPWDDYDPLPMPGSPYDKAYALTREGFAMTLLVMLKDAYYKGFAWSNFDSVDLIGGDKPGSGPVVVLRFAGLEPTELRISGRNPAKLLADIGRGRVWWIREQPSKRGFDTAPAPGNPAEAITNIAVGPWQPERPSKASG